MNESTDEIVVAATDWNKALSDAAKKKKEKKKINIWKSIGGLVKGKPKDIKFSTTEGVEAIKVVTWKKMLVLVAKI